MNKKNKFLILKKTFSGNSYCPKYPGDRFLSILAWMFDEGKLYIIGLKEKLLNNKQGLIGDAIDVDLKNNIVYIMPLYGEDADDYQITIEKSQLIQLIDEWLELIKKNPDEIIMMRDEQGAITLEGIFKEKPETRNN